MATTITLQSRMNTPNAELMPLPRLNADQSMRLAEGRPGKVPEGMHPAAWSTKQRKHADGPVVDLLPEAMQRPLLGQPCAIGIRTDLVCSPGAFQRLVNHWSEGCCFQCVTTFLRNKHRQ